MPDESYRRRLWSLLLCLCDIVCSFVLSAAGFEFAQLDLRSVFEHALKKEEEEDESVQCGT